MNPTALGSGARMANAFALVNSQAVYEGQRRADPDKRVFILTRSAFAGTQRYASATWSGRRLRGLGQPAQADPGGPQHGALRRSLVDHGHRRVHGAAQVVEAGSRGPRTSRSGASSPRAGSSTPRSAPLLRVHGQFPRARCGSSAATKATARTRRSSPSTGSATGCCRTRTRWPPRSPGAHATIMRPLVMDFREDPEVLGIGDQFLFGPSLLVSPVTSPGATRRPVYLPRGAGWYDFWTGTHEEGGRALDAPAPYESMPVYVRAGSILPMGRSFSTRRRSRPTRSPSGSTGAPTPRSSSTKTTASRTATRRAPSPRSRCAGTRGAARSRSARARARSPGCSPRARSAWCSCPRGRRSAIRGSPGAHVVRYEGQPVVVKGRP